MGSRSFTLNKPAQVNHRVGKESKTFMSFFQPFIPGSKFTVRLFPGKTSFHFVALFVNMFNQIKSLKLRVQDFFFLAASGVGFDDWRKAVHLDFIFRTFGIKARI